MKIKKDNKGFALVEILAVTLALMAIFTVLYSNFMPLSGEYAKSEKYNDVSSQYQLHYFRKLFQEIAPDDILQGEEFVVLIGDGKNFCNSLNNGVNVSICNAIKKEISFGSESIPTLILTNYDITSLKNGVKGGDINLGEADVLRSYILSLPDFKDGGEQEEVYRLIIKTNSGYATVKLKYDQNVSEDGEEVPEPGEEVPESGEEVPEPEEELGYLDHPSFLFDQKVQVLYFVGG